MHITSPWRKDSASSDAPTTVLALARRLHRDARSDSLALSLPVLRRIIASRTLVDISLPLLQHKRDMVQRKHILRMLAIEAGFTSWEDYRHALDRLKVDDLAHFDLARGRAGYPNLWFSSREEAASHALEHGGRVLEVGVQAVVFVD